MFEATLKEKLKTVFDFDKVTYDEVSESFEQECMFVEVVSARTTIKDGLQLARVEGLIKVYANADKLPFGYFQKKIKEADPSDTMDLFFYDIETNAGVRNNIKERSMSFVYFYSGQYDPNLGTITSIEISEAQA